jgi:hypothetical protein
MKERRNKLVLFVVALAAVNSARAAEPATPLPPEGQREAAIAEFTRKMQAANYPALFEKAANEFNVPADVLKGVAFAETRWEHLTWPPGETASPETGMPRPYGIMSLWDNPFFGRSLLQAANLIGQDPEVLKQDPLQNMRGAAALLRKLFDENRKPPGTSDTDVEAWRYAIRKYCGIPEPDLNARHALEVYTFMNQGYHQFGIEWNGRKVNLEPIRQETVRIMAEEQARREARLAAGSNAPAPPPMLAAETGPVAGLEPPRTPALSNTSPAVASVERLSDIPSTRSTLWFIGGALLTLAAIVVAARKGAASGP